MTAFATSMPAAYFDDLYAADGDPWRFATSPYERQKYAATIDALPRDHYGAGLEIGCSIGVLTKQLATRCDALLSIDIAEAALAQARHRCADLPQVSFQLAQVPGTWPTGRFDLIVLSEVVYYLDRRDVERLAGKVMEAITADGDIVLVHWLGETNYPLGGDAAAELMIASLGSTVRVHHQAGTDAYRLDVLRAR